MTTLYFFVDRVGRPILLALILLVAAFSGLAQQGDGEKEEPRAAESRQTETAEKDGRDAESEEDERREEALAEDPSVKRITPAPKRQTADETTRSESESPLVRAARSSSRGESKRSFTDADLSSSKGRLIVVEGTNVREPDVTPIEERIRQAEREEEEKAREREAERAEQYHRDRRISQLTTKVTALESQLRRLENDFYVTEEDDKREALQEEYVETKEALKSAREELSQVRNGSGEN
ncbi:MAG: hypothetical protein R3338_07325 [Thermoanaerobaculia bacterium]|nr:hypothetical protein [Thermoanaerobaculia bacterium]